MYRLVITFLSIGSMASCVNAQVDSTSNHDWNVFVSPLSILNPSYPAFHAGTERELGKWSTVGELGVLLPQSVYQDESSVIGFQDLSGRNSGFFVKVEGKRYFNKHWYAAVNLQYLYNNTRRTDTFDATPELTDYYAATYGLHLFCSTCIEETYSIRKSMMGLTFKIGVRYDLPKNFYLDGYFGLGVNYHNNMHSGNSELHKNPARSDGLLGYYDTFYPGSYFYHLPVPTIGLRVGYTIVH